MQILEKFTFYADVSGYLFFGKCHFGGWMLFDITLLEQCMDELQFLSRINKLY
jgi:hypothetical protein